MLFTNTCETILTLLWSMPLPSWSTPHDDIYKTRQTFQKQKATVFTLYILQVTSLKKCAHLAQWLLPTTNQKRFSCISSYQRIEPWTLSSVVIFLAQIMFIFKCLVIH